MSNSKIYLGSTNIGTGKIKLGANDVSAIYLGTSLLYPPTTPPTPTGDYLCFTAEEVNATIGMEHFNTNQTTTQPVLYYSTDKTNWTLWDFSTITLQNVGDKVYFYGDNPNGICSGISSSEGYSIFRTTKNVACSGDIMTLLNVNGGYVIPNDYCFYALFENSKITTPPELPATTITAYCYSHLFMWCDYLTTAPVLPATTVPAHAYASMFYRCISLNVAPELPATTLSTQCYSRMFEQCLNLTTAPSVLPATTLADSCYEYMFQYTNLTTAPVLPATTLTTYCYCGMFYNCTSLNNITCLATNITAYRCTYTWMNGVSANGTFTKNPQMSNWTTGVDGIPTGWTVTNLNCSDCTNWSVCGYESYDDCDCQINGNNCPPDCNDWENLGYNSYFDCDCNENGHCIDCVNDWELEGFYSYEDCDCQVNGNCTPEDCSDWENLGYGSYEDCDCQLNGNCYSDPCQECFEQCGGDQECEATCTEEGGPCW